MISEFEGQIESPDFVPACPYFIEVYNEFIIEEEEDD